MNNRKIFIAFTVFCNLFLISLSNPHRLFSDNEPYKLGEKYGKKYGDTYKSGKDFVEVPYGMEIKKIGGINMIVPEGTEVRRTGSRLHIETAEEYSARKFKLLEKNMDTLNMKNTELRKQIDVLTEEIERLKTLTPGSDRLPSQK